MAEQMRAFPSGDWPGKFSVTHALPQALNRSIVLRNHKHAGTGPAQRHRSRVPAQRSLPRARGERSGRKGSSSFSWSRGPGWAETSELSTSHFSMPLFSLAPWEANTPCIRVLPQQTSRGEKKSSQEERSAAPCASSTPPRVPSTQFIFLPIKVSPPAWLCETQFMRGAVGVLLLAGTERGSERGGGSGAEQAALCFGGGSAERGREVPVQTQSLGLLRHGRGHRGASAARRGLGGCSPAGQTGGRGWCRAGATGQLRPLLHIPGQRWGSPRHGGWSHPLPAAENLGGQRVEG